MRHVLKRKLVAFVSALTVFASVLVPVNVSRAEAPLSLHVMFVSDTHSHLENFRTSFEGEFNNMGGFSRVKTIIDDKMADDPEILLLDGGDFSMGTLYQTLYDTQASELRLLGELGVEYTTIGNHEFDFGSKGLASMVDVALTSGDKLPNLLLCNVDWDACSDVAGAMEVKEAFDRWNVQPYAVTYKDGVKIGLIGVFGIDALACAPTCELAFTDPIQSVKKTLAELKANENPDIVILLSHGGLGNATTDVDGSNLQTTGDSEDELMAQQVPGLDLIISGHSHTTVKEPLRYGDCWIAGCGEYDEQVCDIQMTKNASGTWDIIAYDLIKVAEDIEPDEYMESRIEGFKKLLDDGYLSNFGFEADQVLAHNSYPFSSVQEIYQGHEDENLGNIMSDGFLFSAEEVLGRDLDVAVVPSGCIRETYYPGDITVSGVFDSYSLGIGEDGLSGYPLLCLYINGEELKLVAEIDASLSDLMNSARLYCSGMNHVYNPNRLILNKAEDAYLVKDGQRVEIVDDQLYSIVADLYSAQMLSAVTDLSKGLISIELKDENGKPLNRLEDAIIHYDDGRELKAWYSLAHYIGSFEKGEDGVAVVPAVYASHQNRRAINDEKGVSAFFRNPSKYFFILILVIVIVVAVVVLVVLGIVKLIKKIIRKNGREPKRERSK